MIQEVKGDISDCDRAHQGIRVEVCVLGGAVGVGRQSQRGWM